MHYIILFKIKGKEMNKKSLLLVLFLCLITLLTFTCCRQTNKSDAKSNTGDKSMIGDIYKDKVVLIVNGDDFGVTEIFTDATIEAFLKGGISSTSIIANGHDVDRAIKLLKKYPELPVGVHLTLTGDWKPLTDGVSLRNKSGLMWDTAEEAGQNVIPDEASVEWDAQIKKIIDAGINITHLDSHMGCYFLSSNLFIKAYKLAKKHKVLLISSFNYIQIPREEKKFFLLTSYTGIYTLMNKEETVENRAEAYWKMFSEFKPGIYYLYTHQCLEPSDKKITGDLDLRIDEFKFWTGDDTKRKLKEKGYVVISCIPLREEFQKALDDLK